MDGPWTEVLYGRRRNPDRRRPLGQGYARPQWGMDRARASSYGGRTKLPNPPNRPAPPPWTGRYPGPPFRSYAAVVRQGPPAGGWRGRRDPPRTDDPSVRREPAGPQFGRLIRKLYAVIKRVHHLQNVALKQGKQEPRMIARMVEVLSTMITPAFPTQRTADFIVGNAKNWGQVTCQILEDHYERGLEEHLEELRGSLPPDWKTAFEVAGRWARRNLPRITRDVIDHAEALIMARVDAERTETPRREMTTQTGTSPQVPRRSGDGNKSGNKTSVEMGTMTDQQEGEPEWYQVTVQDVEAPRDHREGHGRLRRPRGVVLTEDNLSISEEEEQAEEDWRVVEASEFSDSFSAVAEELDKLDREETTRAHSQVAQTPRHRVEVQVHLSNASVEREAEVVRSLERLFQAESPSYRVRRHPNTKNKNVDWSFVAEKKWLILGDSNLVNFPEFTNPDLQIESFPGANFRNADHVIAKSATSGPIVEKLVLSFGINSRGNKPRETTIKNLQGAVRSAKEKFPCAEIYVPLVNFSGDLPEEERHNLRIVNDYIQRNQPFIPLLLDDEFETEQDQIHWTKRTAKVMFNHWMKALNLDAP